LRPAAAEFFAREAQRSSSKPLTKSASSDGFLSVPVAAVCLLKRLECGNGALLEVRRLSGARAVAAMLDHAFCFTLQDSCRKRSMLDHYLRLAGLVPVIELAFRPGLDVLPNVIDEIVAVLEDGTIG
jgi:hypothetical protein